MATRETLDLLLKLDVQGDAQLKTMANDADKAAQRLQELTQKVETTTRTMSVQQKELVGLQQQYAATAGKATELADRLDKVVASEGRNSAAATKLQSELDRTATAAQKVAIAIEKKEIALQRGSNALQKIAAEAAQTGTALQSEAAAATKSAQAHLQLSRDSEGAGSAFTGIASKLNGLAAGYFSLQGAIQVVEWGKQGAAMQGVADSFDKLASASGTTSDKLLAAMQAASKGTIADSELMAKANQAVLLGGERLATDLPHLLEIARASAKATGSDVNAAFDSLVLGLSRSSKQIIDNLGFTVDVGKANEDYADSLHISVNALTDQQKALAFQAAVMQQGDSLISKLGDDTLTTADKIARAETQIQNFTDKLKIMAGEGLAGAADGLAYLQQIMAGDGGGGDQAQALAITAQSYQQYIAAIQSGDAALLQSTTAQQAWGASFGPLGSILSVAAGAQQAFTGSTETLTEAEFNAAQAMIARGTATEDALAAASGLSETQAALADALTNVGRESGMTEQAQAALIARTMELASSSPEAAAGIAELVDGLDGGRGSMEEFTAGLDLQTAALDANTANQEFAASTAFGYADAQLAAADATDVTTDSIYYLDDAQAEQTNTSAEAELAALNLADAHAMMQQVVADTESGLYTEDQALAILQAQFHLSADAAQRFLNVQLALNAALGKQTSIANMGKLVNVGGKAYEKQVADQQRAAERAGAKAQRDAERAANRAAKPARGGRKGGGGAKSGKPKESEEVKQAKKNAAELDKIDEKVEKAKTDYQRKVEDAAKKHADTLAKIEADYHAKSLEAERKFNADKFDTQLDFRGGLIDLDDDFYDRAHAEEQAYWAESQQLAQAGHAQQAEELYNAGTELANIRAQNAQKERDLQNQINEEEDAAERAKLEKKLQRQREYDAQQEQLAADKVAKIREGGDQLEQERQDAIDKENKDYSEAQDTLKEDFTRTLDDIKTSYADMGAAVRDLADGIIAAAQAATTAVNAIPMPSASGAPAGEAPQGSYATGTGSAGLPRTGPFIGHAGEIILNRKQSDILRQNGGVRALDQGGMAAPLASARMPSPPRAMSGPVGPGGGGGAITIMPGAVVINAPNANASQVAALVDQRLRKFTQDTGGSAASKRKMGT